MSPTVHNGLEFCWLTQEDIMRFLLSSIGLFSAIPTLSIDTLGIISPEFLAVGYHSFASSAIGAISQSLVDQISVAVVDDDGTLIGEISPFALSCCDETVAAAITTLSAGDLIAYIDCGGPTEEIARVVEARLKERNLEGMLEEFAIESSNSTILSSSSSDEELPSPTRTLSRAGRYSRSTSYSARMVRRAEAIVCHPGSSLVAVMIQAIAHRKMAKQKEKSVNVSGKPKHSLDVNRDANKSKNGRSGATVRRLKMYDTRPKRNTKGKILKNDLQSKELPSTRIQPDRRWFGNTRVVNQKELEFFREELQNRLSSNYNVLLKERKIPMSLLNDHQKQARVHLIDTEPFADAFGPKTKRKRPKLMAFDYESLLKRADGSQDAFEEKYGANTSFEGSEDGFRDLVRHTMFEKGQSKRIWGELYKVIDSSDVVVQVLDARDPQGTRCYHLERHLKEHCKHKHMILLLNKCDLVPAWATKGWLRILSKEYPALAFHASINKSFGK
ncbi:nuclear nucleolar GTPase 2, partial [Olea europaea subsp. europaea]